MVATRKVRTRLLTILVLTLSLTSLLLSQSQNTSNVPGSKSQFKTIQVTPATPPTGTLFDHVLVIMMENEGIGDICGGSPPPCSTAAAPFLAGLANNSTLATQYLSVITTSLPNYVALISGSMQGCNDSGCPSPITTPNLVDRFDSAGLTWKGYFENMTAGTGCNAAMNSPEPYTPIHNPFIVFQDVTNNTARCNKLVNANPATCTQIDCTLVSDLNNLTAPAPNLMYLVPNDCDDMRGTSECGTTQLIAPGDAYLSKIVPQILNSHTFTTSRSALYIVFDEGNAFCPTPFAGYYPNGTHEDCVPAVWAGPVVKTGFATDHLYDQYSFVKTVETNWGLAGFTVNDTNAIPMTEFFKGQPADFTFQPSPGFVNNRANPNGPIISPVNAQTNATLILTSVNNYTGTVSLTAASSPVAASLTLTPSSVTLSQQQATTPTLSFTATATGNYTVTVTATSGSQSHNTTILFRVVTPDFTLSSSPGTVTIGQATISTGPSVAVNSTGDNTLFKSSFLSNSFNAQGRTWLFYEDTRHTCEGETGCLSYTSSTDGTKWNPPTNVGVHVNTREYSVYTNGTSVFYARYNETSFESNCGRNLQFRVGTLDPNGTVSWQPEQTALKGSPTNLYPDDEIIIDSTGQAWIAFLNDSHMDCGGTGTDRPQIIHSNGTNYTSWTTPFTLSTAHSNVWQIQLASLGSGKIYAAYWLRNTDLHGRLYNGTAWLADEQISSTTTKADVNSWLFNNGTSLYAIYFDNATESFYFASRSPTGTWTDSLIGPGESHTGANFLGSAYYSLPDTASYDARDNLFSVFYLNGTLQRINEWTGSGSTWAETIDLATTLPAPYPASITSFIQTTTTFTGSIFYITGTTSFTIESASLSYAPAGNTGTFQTTLTPKFGFTGTVTLTTTTSPSTGLAVSCNPTTITGGSGSTLCSLNATLKGAYNITVTGANGTLTHSIFVTVTVLPFPAFSLTTTRPAPALVGDSSTVNVTLTPLNGYVGSVSLTTDPNGLTCGPITPNTITGYGSASLPCTTTVAANYTLTIIGTSGTLTNTTSVTLSFQDFALSNTYNVNSTGWVSVNITITPINGFKGKVTLTSVLSGFTCNPIMPNTVNVTGILTVSCAAHYVGDYTFTLTATSGTISHSMSIPINVISVGGSIVPDDELKLLLELLPGFSVSTAVLGMVLVSIRDLRKRRTI